MDKEILFVDDEPEWADPQVEALQNMGYKVTHAMDSEEAIASLDKKNFDLIILDILMPSGQTDVQDDMVEVGLKLYQQIRSRKQLQKVPIIFLSVVRDPQVITEITDHERSFGHKVKFISKPALPIDVVDEVQKILSR